MRILITGGAGFIGSHLVDRFHERGDDVFVIDNLVMGVRANVRDEATFYQEDICDRAAVFRVFAAATPDVVLHLAAQAGVVRSMADPGYDLDVNIRGTVHVLEAARQCGVKQIVFTSTGGAIYGAVANLPTNETSPPAPTSCYGVSKAAAEMYIRVFAKGAGLAATVLRFANVYGPRQKPKGEAGVVAIFSLNLLAGRPCTIFGDGSKTRDYVFVGDVVAAVEAAVASEVDGTFNIGTGRQISDQQVFDEIRGAVGSNLNPIYAERRSGEVEHIALDAMLAGERLGWKPTVAFEDGIQRTVASYRKSPT